jgi:hypothetical protein
MDSTKQEARARIAALRAGTGTSPWKIARDALSDRLEELVEDPDLVDQDALNLCGPAALLRVWLVEDPLAVVQFASTLYERGAAFLGGLRIEPGPDSLIQHDYATLKALVEAQRPPPAPFRAFCPVAEWMVLGAIRDSENVAFDFEGLPDELLAGPSGLTTPGEIEVWLEAIGLYDEIREEANIFFTKGLAHARGLRPGARDVLLLINAHMLRKVDGVLPRKSGDFLVNAFPNHWVVLTTPITETPDGHVEFSCWSWGLSLDVSVTKKTFEANYYGALIARLAAYSVVIGDVVADPPGQDVAFGAGEFVRLDNIGPRTAAVGGWRLEDAADHRLLIPRGHEIPPGGSLFVHTGPGDPSPGRCFAGRRKAVWNNRGGDTVRLVSFNGRLLDSFSYAVPPVPAA